MLSLSQTGSMEVWLHNLAADILDVDPEDLDADKSFLALGGDSLSAIEFMGKCYAEGVQIKIPEMMGDISMSQLIQHIAQSQPGKESDTDQSRDSSEEGNSRGTTRSSQVLALRINSHVPVLSVRLALETVVQRHKVLQAQSHLADYSVSSAQPVSNGTSSSWLFKEIRAGNEGVCAAAVEEVCKTLGHGDGPVFGGVFCEPSKVLVFAASSDVVDQTSWRILIRDFITALEDALGSEAATTSDFGFSNLVATDTLSFLLPSTRQDSDEDSMMTESEGFTTLGESWERKDTTISLNETTSKAILGGSCHKALRTSAVDIINAALLLTALEFELSEGPAYLWHVFNKRHGHPDMLETVGSFDGTVLFEIAPSTNPSTDLKITPMEMVRSVKDASILSTVPPRPSFRRVLEDTIDSTMRNGRFKDNNPFVIEVSSTDTLPIDAHPKASELERLVYAQWGNTSTSTAEIDRNNGSIQVFLHVWDEQLKLTIRGGNSPEEEAKVQDFAAATKQNLTNLVEELNNTPITPTLSDFPQLHATYPALDSLFTRLQSVTPDPLTALQAIGPCSPMQDNFLVSQRKTPDAYQCRFVVRIDALVPGSKLDPEAVKAHWAQIIARHPILRTTFVESDTRLGRFDQVVWKSIAPWVLTYPDATAIFNDTDFPTYAAHQPQHRLSIAPAPKGGAFVKLDISHALFDGQSTEVLMRDFCFSYLDALETDDALPYLDFTAGELQADTAPTSAYWARYMDNAQGSYLPVRHSLETSGLQSIQAQTVLSPGALSSFCGQYGVTPANICQVAWGLVLRSFANSDDVCFAYVTARRQTPLAGIQDAVGPFLDVLFCRLNMEGSAGVSELLSLANQDFLASLEHQNTTIAMKNDAHGTSVREWGNTILSFTRAVPAREYARAGLAFELLQRATPTDYDVSVNIDIGADNLDFNLDFWESKMDRPLAQSILGVFQEAISFVLRSGSQETIHKFSPLTEAHKAELGRSLGPSGENTFFACSEVCIHDLVQEIAARQPRSPAVCAWDGTWTFEQLVDSASALSRVLILEQSVKPDNTTVGICMEKSKWTVVAMLAVLMSGAAIVPVGADDPRAEELLRSANASFVLASHNTCDRVRAMSFPVIVVGDINSLKSTTAQENGDVRPLVAPDSPAWILFTSGSSGKPKGVVLEHRALSTSLLAQGKAFEIGPGVRTLQFAAYTFADSIPDIFGTLVMGGCVCAPSEEERTTDLARAMHKLLVNQATLTSTVAGLLLDPKEAPALRRLILSGEMPSTAVVKKWLPYTQVVNGYGQSEASVFACCGQITDPEDAANIGLPIAGRCWVVQPDDYNRLCPIGGPGELLIESPALARGYLNDTDRTASVFVDNPTFLEELAPSSSSSTSTPYPRRMYRTGDLVRQNSLNGTLTFLGRQDTQIKIRGQRVELGEIESTIAPLLPADTFSSVVVSLVKLSSPVQSEPKLVAALEVSSSLITSDEDTIRPLNPTELSLVLKTSMEMLQDTLLVKLPVYMVPGLFVPMTKLPVNASKKVDRRALQTILEAMDDAQIKALMLVDESQQQPRTETELQLQDLWAVAFSRPAESISIKEHFFQAGGDSVTAVRMVAAGRNVGIALTVADIFKYPRIEDLARVLEDVDDAATAQAAPGNDPQPFQLWEDHSDDDLLTLAAQCNVKVGQIEDVYPCTPLQEGLVAITAQRARADAYMVQRCYRIAEDVPLEGFQAAWERLVELITILRTRIAMSSRGVAVQVVVDEVVNWQQNHRGRSLFEYLQEDSQVPFDYGQPLTRVALINGGEPEDDHRYFVWSIHHSLFDGWSTVQTLNLLARLWTGQQLTSPPVPMSRFIQYLAHQDKEASRQFWKRHLHNVTSSRFPVLPHVEYQPSPIQKLTRQVTLDADRKSTVTTSTLLRATWAILLASYTGTQEAVMLLTLSGRNAPVPGILNILAPTLTSVPFRVSILPRQSLYDFLQEVQSRTTEMIPFEHTGLQNIRRLVPDLGGDFDPGHVFTVQASPPPEEGNSQAALTDRLERLGSDRDGLQSYALTLDCIIDQEDSSVTLEARFDADVLPSAHAESILAHFDYVLRELSSNGGRYSGKLIEDLDTAGQENLQSIRAQHHHQEALPSSTTITSNLENGENEKETNGNYPATALEQKLRQIWSEALSLPLRDIPYEGRRFVALGGDSIAAIRVVTLCRGQSISVSLRDVIQCQSISDLARHATSLEPVVKTPPNHQLRDSFFTRGTRSLSDFPIANLTPRDLETLAAPGTGFSLADVEDILPCSPIQQGILLSQIKSPQSYSIFQTFRLRPVGNQQKVNVQSLEQAWRQLQTRHSIMRTVFVDWLPDQDEFHQVVLRSPEADILLKTCPDDHDPVEYLETMAPFKEIRGQPPHRLTILQAADGLVYGRIETTHALIDAASFEILTRELLRGYESLPFTTPGTNYGSYVSYLRQRPAEQDLQFWTDLLSDVSPCLLPAAPPENTEGQNGNRPRPIEVPYISVVLDNLSTLQSMQKSEGVTLASIFELAWAIILATYTGTNDVSWGGLFNGRDIPVKDADLMVGPMINQTIHFIPLDWESTVGDAVRDVQRRFLDAFEHQRSSLAAIQHALKHMDGVFFNTLMSYRRQHNQSAGNVADSTHNHSLLLEPITTSDPTEYDITLHVLTDDHEIQVAVQYSPEFMSRPAAQGLLGHFVEVIQSLAEDPSRRIKDFARPSMKDLAKIQAWNHCNETQTEPQDTAHELVQQRLLMHPDRVAVDAWDGTLTGRELDEASNSLAGYLISEAQVTADTLVGFCMNKSKWAIVAMLGILKSGGAVVPFSVQEPLSRIEMTARSSGTKIMVGDKEHVARLEAFKSQGMRVIAVQDVLREVPTHTAAPPTASVSSDNIAFVMHTSGSTGTPKGVVVSHASLCASMKAWTKNPDVGFGPQARILQFTAFTFDPANHEILSGLYSGGCVCVPSEYDRFNNMDKFIQDFQITTATLTPSVARTITPEALPSLQTLVLMGEAVKPSDVEAWLDRGSSKLVNAYGPTECTIIVSVSRPLSVNHQAPIIGYPLENVKMWVTQPDDFNSLCPVGAPGELLVEGPLVANGYLHDAKQTAATFVTDPAFVKQLSYDGEQQYTNRRMYRTGDIVRQNQDGSLTYIGRRDNQIKINGQRVETSEIENAILRAASPDLVQMACVALVAPLGKTNTAEEPRLLAAVQIGTAYIASVSDEVSDGIETEFGLCKASTSLLLELDELRRSLLDILPSYMVPSVMVPFNKIPLTSAGKVDRPTVRHALSTLSEAQLNTILPITSATSMSKRSPSSSTERKLQSLWASVLQKAPEFISNDDDFFQVGGDSISAMKLVAAARRAQPPVILTVATIFQHPRLSDLAAAMDKETHSTNGFSSSPETQKADSAPFALLGRASPNLLDHQIGSLSEQCGVSPEDIEDVYPCAPLQEGLIAITTKRPDKYVLRRVFRIHGDVHVFKKAWEKLWESLAIMRTRIVPGKAGALQVVVREPVHWQYASSLAGYMEQDRSDHMTYGSRLCRIAIINDTSASGHKHVVWTMHHSIYDGWSMLRTMDMLTRLVRNEPVPQPVPMSRFIRYLQDQNEESTRLFWRKHLGSANVIKFPELPIDPSFLPQSTQHARRHISRRSREALGSVTTSNLLRAAWAVLLAAYAGTDTDEVIIMAALSGRQAPVDGILNMVGPTVATVPVRVQIPQQDSLPTFLSRVQQDAVDMIPHEHTGLQNIKRYVPELDEGLFTPAHLFTVQAVIEGDDEVLQPSSSTSEMATAVNGSAKILTSVEKDDRSDDAIQGYAFNMECTIITDKEIDVDIWFDQTTISASQVHRILEQYENIVQQLFRYSNDESRLVCQLSLISPEDHSQISTWNKTVPERTTQCIHEILQEIAARQPDAPAICSWDGDLTYRELVETGSRLAHYLHNLHKGVGPEALLGLCMSKSKWALVAAVAILQAGAGVVPLGIGHPVVRIQTIVENTGTQLILTDKEQAERLSSLNGATTIIIDDALMNSLPPYTPTPACSTVTADNVSYVVFTSGSTGTPKGSVLEHGALAASLLKHSRMLHLEQNSRALQFAAFTFDNSISDIFATLFQGGCVCEPSEDDRVSNLAKAVWDLRVNFLSLTPTVAAMLRPQDVPPIEVLVVGGEPLDPNVIDIWGKSSAIINSYGPSECSILVACSRPLTERRDAPNVGLPVACCFWVVSPNDYNRLSPIGAPGELLLQGAQLGRGYINEPEKTAKAFVVNPTWVQDFPIARNQRLYRSGDLVRQNPDQSLTMLGRRDTQVKIHGQRVEIGEIESWIVRLMPEVRKAAVDYIALAHGRGDRVLVAALEMETTSTTKSAPVAVAQTSPVLRRRLEQLRTELRAVIPSYMIPNNFLPVTRLPLNPSSKLDRLALRNFFATLSASDWNHYLFSNASDKSVATETEALLRQLWATVLSFDENLIGREDKLFDLGGDSVVAMRLAGLAREAGLQLTVADILGTQVLEKMASAAREISPNSLAALRPDQYRRFSLVPDQQHKTAIVERTQRYDWFHTSGAEVVDVAPVTDFQAVSVEGMLSKSRMDLNYIGVDGTGPFDIDRLKTACLALIEQIETLRTAFVEDANHQFWQVILNAYKPNIREYLTDESIASFTETFIKQDMFGMPVQGRPPVDIAIITNTDGSNQHRILFRISHALYDAHSLPLVWETLMAVYKGTAVHPHASFVSYLSDIHSRIDESSSLSYWRQFLAGSVMPQLGQESHQNEVTTTSTKHLKASFLPKETLHIPTSVSSGMMPAVIVKAAWGLVLIEHTGLSDLIFAEASTGRNAVSPAVADAHGCCVTALPFRFVMPAKEDAGGVRTISELLDAVLDQQTKSIQHETIGTQRIINDCAPSSSWNRLTSLINHQRAPEASGFVLGETEYIPSFLDSAEDGGFYMLPDISISATQGPGSLEIRLGHAVDVVDAGVAARLLRGLCAAIKAISARPEESVSSVRELVKKAYKTM